VSVINHAKDLSPARGLRTTCTHPYNRNLVLLQLDKLRDVVGLFREDLRVEGVVVFGQGAQALCSCGLDVLGDRD
jgi:hypothetical protein